MFVLSYPTMAIITINNFITMAKERNHDHVPVVDEHVQVQVDAQQDVWLNISVEIVDVNWNLGAVQLSVADGSNRAPALTLFSLRKSYLDALSHCARQTWVSLHTFPIPFGSVFTLTIEKPCSGLRFWGKTADRYILIWPRPTDIDIVLPQ